jgi:mono/diheme cytochrome c family protein
MSGAGRVWSISGLTVAASAISMNLATGGLAQEQAGGRAPEAIYAGNCGYCHGHNVGPIIRGRNLPPQLVEYMVRNGNGAMPAFRPTEITPAELAALARWISQSADDPKEHGR